MCKKKTFLRFVALLVWASFHIYLVHTEDKMEHQCKNNPEDPSENEGKYFCISVEGYCVLHEGFVGYNSYNQAILGGDVDVHVVDLSKLLIDRSKKISKTWLVRNVFSSSDELQTTRFIFLYSSRLKKIYSISESFWTIFLHNHAFQTKAIFGILWDEINENVNFFKLKVFFKKYFCRKVYDPKSDTLWNVFLKSDAL